MTKILSYIHGIYPRSNELAQTTRDVGRKRKSLKDLKREQKKDLDRLIKLQKSLGFDYIEDGKFTWQDIFRPISENTRGIELGALTRWYDNNSFYRQPVFEKKIAAVNPAKIGSFFPKVGQSGSWKVTLPSPYALAKLSQDISSSNFEETLEKSTEIIKKLIPYLESKGVSLIQLNEPAILYYKEGKKEIGLLIKSLESLYKGKKKALLGVQFYFGDAGPVLKELGNRKIADIIGVDFFRTDLLSVPKNPQFALAAGILEGRNSLLEDSDKLAKFVERVIKVVNPKELYLTHNSDFDLLPQEVANQKVELLGNLRKKFKDEK